MDDRTPVIVDCDLYTAFGPGVEPCWNGLLGNRAAFSDCSIKSSSFFFCFISRISF